jgi:hypothetical protein
MKFSQGTSPGQGANEIGSDIYKNDGHYLYSTPFDGAPDQVNFWSAPGYGAPNGDLNDTSIVGFVHTHPDDPTGQLDYDLRNHFEAGQFFRNTSSGPINQALHLYTVKWTLGQPASVYDQFWQGNQAMTCLKGGGCWTY